MSSPFSASRSHASAAADDANDGGLSVAALQKAKRGSRRDSVLPLCMSRDQHAAVHASPTAARGTNKHRRQRLNSISAGKGSQSAYPTAASPATSVTTANGWNALLAHPDTNQEIARAVQMCSLYPTLRVAGTAFENSLYMAHRLSAETFTLPSSSRRGTELHNASFSLHNRDEVPRSPRMSTSVLMETSFVLREAAEDWRAFHGGGNASGHARNSVVAANHGGAAADTISRTIALAGGTKMVQMACAMKRAAMWEVVVVTALAHRAMELKFRRDRLRRVLERHLLPTLLERKKATGSLIAKGSGGAGGAANRRGQRDTIENSATSSMGAESSTAPQGSYLRDHSAFFASLNNAALLQSFAETMSRHRFLPGEIIARAGQLSQKAMYFLISGKCEVMKERGESAADDADLGEDSHVGSLNAANTTNGSAETPTYKDGMHSAKAPRLRQRGKESAVSRTQKEVIMPGTTFGGIFGGNAVFAGTYRALSQCIVWELRAIDFEQVFRPFSDHNMLDKYKESMRAHSLTWLLQHYPQAKVFGSIPIYRKLASRKSRYLTDFKPVAKARGELLFAQDDLPGDVYCLLEGTVLRRTRRSAGEEGVAQRLATNAFSALRAAGRFVLLGEEPHILPGVQPYSCTVSSRVALFYKIPGERFVSALLDDPTLYAQLRERLMKQRQASMVLRPECLAYVPLLQRFPAEKRAELVQFAQPRVLGRSTSLCEPAQHLSELMLVVSGDVCDPRRYGQRPTTSLQVPASCDADAGDEEGGGGGRANVSFRGKAGKAGDRRLRETGAASHNSAVGFDGDAAGVGGRRGLSTMRASVAAKSGSHLVDVREVTGDGEGDRTVAASDAVTTDWEFSVSEMPASGMMGSPNVGSGASFNSGSPAVEASALSSSMRAHGAPPGTMAQQHQKLSPSAALVHPDESEDINPPPPSQPSRSFLYALGGSWEALLLDKWPNGWEATSTVALWAIPTHKLRLVYNSCSKATQTYILNGVRLAQKEDQHLPSIPHTKMPPMTAYTQRGEAAAAAPTGAAVEASSQSSARASVHRRVARKQHQQPQQQQQSSSTEQPNTQRAHEVLQPFVAPSDGIASFYRGGDGPAAGQRPEDPLKGRNKAARTPKARAPASLGAGAKGPAAPGGQKDGPTAARQPSPHSPQRNPAKKSTATPSTMRPAHTSAGTAPLQEGKKKATDAGAGGLAPVRSRAGVTAAGGGPRRALASTSPPPPPITIDPAVKAAYDGVLGSTDPLMLRIVRDPVVSPVGGSTSSAHKASAPGAVAFTGRSLPPLSASMSSPVLSLGTTGVSSAAWPAQAPVHDRWFQAVPSYEPLPGTLRAADTLAAPPVFAPNSTVLASAGMGPSEVHSKTLEGHVAYYAASVSPSAASSTRRNDAARDLSVGVSPHPLPKRRAYAS